MADDITYEFIWKVWQQEKKSGELQPLPKTFYKNCEDFLAKPTENLPNQTATNPQNAEKLLAEIIAKRKQKMLINAAYNRQELKTNIPEEISFYNSIREIMAENNFLTTKKANKTKLMALADIPQIILPSGSTIGPLKKGQTLKLDSQPDAKYLIDNAICSET